MNDLLPTIAVLAGLIVRLAIPVLITALIVDVLRRLDARWQAEGKESPVLVEKPECWEVMGCAPDRRAECPGYTSPLPCWQARRADNGYLREECLSCQIFRKAPAPALG